ncbi:MAG: nucleotide-binding protein [Nanoarchaeota archaeon]|nr:nucleotide-binding protein [Nanoarchaeota archaeon]
MKIILDTNFLLIPSQFKLDIFSEIKRIADFNYELYIIDKTVDELKGIIKDKGQKEKNKLAAKIALQLIRLKKVKDIKTKDNKIVDDLILDIVNKNYIVATSDRILKQKLRKKGITLIILKNKRYLECQ